MGEWAMRFSLWIAATAWLLTACQIQVTPRAGLGDPNNHKANSPDPEYYRTPTAVGMGLRRIDVLANSASSLTSALSNAKAGDLITIPEGYYVLSTPVVISGSGTAENWIVVQAAPGASPTISFNNTGDLRVSSSYFQMEGIEIAHGKGSVLRFEPQSIPLTDIVLRRVTLGPAASGPGSALGIRRASRIYVEESHIEGAIGGPLIDVVASDQIIVRDTDLYSAAYAWGAARFRAGSRNLLFERNLVRGVREATAVMIGGYSDPGEFDPNFPDQEALNAVARNNLLADCDHNQFEIRGATNVKVFHNTVVTQTDTTVYLFSYGNTASGFRSSNEAVGIAKSIVVAKVNNPYYARNDANLGDFRFGPHLWTGEYQNSPTPGLPAFPTDEDFPVQTANAALVLESPTYVGLTGMADARLRYRPAAYSAAYRLGMANLVTPLDILQVPRDPETPTVGAFE